MILNDVPVLTGRGYAALRPPREGHQWGELRQQLYKGNAELEWFEHEVRGQSYQWERAPGDPQEAVKSAFPN